ncbi:MAG: response regulator transcription factor [Thermomicrobiales bacterium]
MTESARQTVLLVEDTRELAQVIARELEAAGYRVVRAGDGQTALELHARERPDLVVLDWMLPRMSGIDVLREVRQTSATPVLMLTARGEEADRVIGLELGADDYLSKPFSTRELIARVRALLRRGDLLRQAMERDRDADAAPVAYGPLRLDPARHLATLDDEPIELTPHELALLRLLLSNPGRAFSRAYLLDTVWGADSVTGDRAVDNAVFRLRKKLGPVGEAIEAVWGVGYRLRARKRDS